LIRSGLILAFVLTLAISPIGSAQYIERLDPKMAIAQQMELLESGDLTKLKSHFTSRLQDLITQEIVAKAQKEIDEYTLEDLVASAEYGTSEGRETVKIKMRNGRSLTTLIWTEGKWLADTIWFR
jgi:hypothetical protein